MKTTVEMLPRTVFTGWSVEYMSVHLVDSWYNRRIQFIAKRMVISEWCDYSITLANPSTSSACSWDSMVFVDKDATVAIS